MIALNRTLSSATAAMHSVVPDENRPLPKPSTEETLQKRLSLKDVVSAWLSFLVLLGGLGIATLIFDLLR